MEAVVGLEVQKFMSFVRTLVLLWRWVLMVKAWICLSSLREVHLGMRERREGEGSSAKVVDSCLGVSVLSLVGECEMHWRMGAAIVVVRLIA